MNNGNALVISLIFIAIIIVIFIFILGIFMSNVNSMLYNIKLDMYAINRAGIIAVNKNQANIQNFTYSVKEYKNYFEKVLKANYDLDENLSNNEKLITKIKIDEYAIIEAGARDTFTNRKANERVLHTVITVNLKPIILSSLLEKVFTFQIHEDVNLSLVKE